MAQKRSYEMQLVGYALARCGLKRPPEWLNVQNWDAAYDLFFDALGEERSPRTFRNSLKNVRDAFDGHVESDRTGWVDHKAGGKPYRQDSMVARILTEWKGRSDTELRDAVLALLVPDESLPGPEEAAVRTEGGAKVYVTKRYEREASLRNDAIAFHGRDCMGCGYNFDARYGVEHSKGYIEVHHSVPLADKGVRKTDPRTDLVVLCANCHRMVHKSRSVCLSLAELRAKLLSPTTNGK
jgi:5-methylcytosine-specific restriction protein A